MKSKVIMAEHKSNLYNNMTFSNNMQYKLQNDVFGNRKKSISKMMPNSVIEELDKEMETVLGQSTINEEFSALS